MSLLTKPITIVCLSFILVACGGGENNTDQHEDPVVSQTTDPSTPATSGDNENESVQQEDPVVPPTTDPTSPTNTDLTNTTPTISGSPDTSIQVGNAYSFTPSADDSDGNPLRFSINNKPNWATFDDSTGVLAGTPITSDEGVTSNIVITVSDGELTGSLAAFDIEVNATAITLALRTGNSSLVDKSTVLSAFNTEISIIENRKNSILSEIFKLDNDGNVTANSPADIIWDPSHDSVWFDSTKIGENLPLLVSNSSAKKSESSAKNLAMAGVKLNGARYIAMGSNVLHDIAHTNQPAGTANEQMQVFMENALAWLTDKPNFKTESSKIVIAHQSDSYWFKHDQTTQDWVNNTYPEASVNEIDSCESANLTGCLSDADLLIIGRDNGENDNHGIEFDLDVTMAAVKNAQANGTPVLYLQYDGGKNDLSSSLMGYFGLSTTDNYWRQEGLNNFSVSPSSLKDSTLETIKKTIAAISADTLNLNFNITNCPDDKCNAELITDSGSGESYQTLLDGSNFIKSTLASLDSKNEDIFNDGMDNKLLKLVVLLGDKYRQETTFPMDKYSSDSADFMRALYADYAIYNSRDINPVQKDMGNFSRSDFSHISPTNKTVAMQSKRNFRSAGVYALPGQTFTVKRNDNSDLVTKIYINSVRSGSTHLYESNGYKRPKFIQSSAIEVKSGETIKMTSPLGGPIQISFDTNDLDVSFTFSNIGEHAYWKSTDDDQSFTDKLAANEYDWAELSTPGFEVHSKLDKIIESMNDPKWGSAKVLSEATTRYMHNLPHGMAGFKGPGIDVIPELTDFANDKGWEIDTLDKVQHMNADQATCGYGCSGNPYDAYWAYDPIGHGDVHELGHGLQGGKRFAGWENHSMTNHYSYNTKSKYHTDTGGDPNCQALPFEKMFNVLQQSVNEVNAAAYIKTNLWDSMGWSEGAGMFIQMMMSAQYVGALEDGWMLRGRLHMFEREFNRAKQSEDTWLAKRGSLGMGEYTLTEAKAIDNNDWYLISTSFTTSTDYRDYFDMWGLTYSAKAASQVATLNFASITRQYFLSDSKAYCFGLDKPAVNVDGAQTWPVFD